MALYMLHGRTLHSTSGTQRNAMELQHAIHGERMFSHVRSLMFASSLRINVIHTHIHTHVLTNFPMISEKRLLPSLTSSSSWSCSKCARDRQRQRQCQTTTAFRATHEHDAQHTTSMCSHFSSHSTICPSTRLCAAPPFGPERNLCTEKTTLWRKSSAQTSYMCNTCARNTHTHTCESQSHHLVIRYVLYV